MKLQHIKVRHKHEIISRGLLQSLNYKIIHDGQIIEQICGAFCKEVESWVMMM